MYTLSPLPYAFDALEPYIDAATMQIHHDKHHQTYVDKLNAALERHPELSEKKLEELLSNLESIPEDIRSAVRNHGGGHFNHSFFWPLLSKEGIKQPLPELGAAIARDFGSFDSFKENFIQAATNQFGSGWAWLSLNKDNKLVVHSTTNQDNPLMQGMKPIIGLDVWEHAYYLKYQNKRPDYISAFWNVINWEQAEKNFKS
mgnify:FL=1